MLLAPHLDELFRLAARLAPRREDAESLFRDTLDALFARRAELSSIRDLVPYLKRILYLCFSSEPRRYGRMRLALVSPDEARDAASTTPGDGRSDEARIDASLALALTRLSEEQRVALVLSDAEGYSASTIGDIVDVPAEEVVMRARAARARMRTWLRDAGVLFVQSADSVPGERRDAM